MNWEKIYSADRLIKVEMLRAYLESHGIPAIVMNKKDSMYGFGRHELFTNREHVLKAIKLVEEYKKA